MSVIMIMKSKRIYVDSRRPSLQRTFGTFGNGGTINRAYCQLLSLPDAPRSPRWSYSALPFQRFLPLNMLRTSTSIHIDVDLKVSLV